MKEVIGTIVLIMLAGIPAAWPQASDSATFRVVENMYGNFATERKIPGLAFGIVIGGKLAYAKGIGYSDVEGKVPVSPSSVYRIASMTKSFTALAILKQ